MTVRKFSLPWTYTYYPWLTKVALSTKGQLRYHSSSVSYFTDEKTEVLNY